MTPPIHQAIGHMPSGSNCFCGSKTSNRQSPVTNRQPPSAPLNLQPWPRPSTHDALELHGYPPSYEQYVPATTRRVAWLGHTLTLFHCHSQSPAPSAQVYSYRSVIFGPNGGGGDGDGGGGFNGRHVNVMTGVSFLYPMLASLWPPVRYLGPASSWARSRCISQQRPHLALYVYTGVFPKDETPSCRRVIVCEAPRMQTKVFQPVTLQ